MVDLSKLDSLLCFAFQHSNGPFDVVITKKDNFNYVLLTKQDILDISDQEDIISIKLAERITTKSRRWRKRGLSDRRFK